MLSEHRLFVVNQNHTVVQPVKLLVQPVKSDSQPNDSYEPIPLMNYSTICMTGLNQSCESY